MIPDPGLASWLQVSLTPGIGSSALRALLRQYGLPQNILERSDRELRAYAPGDWLAALRSAEVLRAVERSLEWASRPRHFIVTLADDAYPRALLEIADPPCVLYARGRPELLNAPALAVIGSRNASPQGVQNAEHFSKAFSEAGYTIVSGLALGIDSAAHRGGLCGPGSTIAVLGTGVDVAYPSRNAALAGDIGERGLLLSEFALGAPPVAHHFPRRNRLISGLAQGCLVVEAALASGSLITARAAADQGREVFAIPGSIHSPLAKGCHALIKAGAKLVESAGDVLAELPGARLAAAPAASLARAPRAEPAGLLAHIGHDPVDVDALCSRAAMPAEQVSAELLRLELDGHIAVLPGGLYQRLKKGDAP